MYCKECGKEINDKAVICPECGCKTSDKLSINTEKNKWVALLLWLFLGSFGAHRFYIGDNSGGAAYLICLFLSWLIVPGVVLVILWIVDLIAILQGNLKDVKLEG